MGEIKWASYIFLFLISITGQDLSAQLVPFIQNFPEHIHGGYNQTWGSTQAPSGKMYFANTTGLLEYTGTRWNQYPLPENKIPRCVFSDSAGRIFAGGYQQMGYWQKNDVDSMTFLSLTSLVSQEELGTEEIWHISPFGEKIIFQSFSKLFIYGRDTITSVLPPGNIMYVEEIDNQLIVPVIDSGLFVLQPDLTFRFLDGTDALSDKKVTTILPFGNQALLIGTAHRGLFIYKDNKLAPWTSPDIRTMLSHQINTGVNLKDGLFAFGTIQNGIYVLNKEGNLVYQLNQKNALMNNTVLHLLEDRSGLLWAGLDNGISLVEIQSPLTLYQDKIGSIGTTYSGTLLGPYLYVGTNQGVFYSRWRPSIFGIQLVDFPMLKVEGTQGQVWDLYAEKNQLLCAHNEGSFIIKNNKATKLTSIGAWKWVPHPNNSDVLFQANYNGISIFRKDNRQQWQYAQSIDTLSFSINEMLFVNTHEALITSPHQKLKKIKFNYNYSQVTDIQDIDSLGKDITISKWQDKIILHTAQRNLIYDPHTQVAETFSLPLEQNLDKVFYGNEDTWFAVTSSSIQVYQDSQGLAIPLRLHNEYECITPLNDSSFLIGLDGGYALFNDSRIQHIRKNATPTIDYVEIQTTQDKYRISQDEFIKGITLPARTRHITIYYALTGSHQVELVEYLIEGLHAEWQTAQNGKIYLPGIPSGEFTFKLKTKTSIFDTKIDVLPPWHLSKWAFLLYSAILLGLLHLLYRWHIGRLKNQEFALEQKRIALEKEAEAKQKEKERLLHEQLIQSENERLQFDIQYKSKELANAAIALAKYNEALTEIKEELKQLKESVHNKDKGISKAIRLLESNLSDQSEWQVFKTNFNQVHEQFMRGLHEAYPDLSQSDLQLAAYIRMGLSSKEIAPILNISVRGMENKRYRLRKKLGLTRADNLARLLEQF